MAFVCSFKVRDSHGDELTIYEFRERRMWWKVRTFRLDSGEAVTQLNHNQFSLTSGERLVRVDPGGKD